MDNVFASFGLASSGEFIVAMSLALSWRALSRAKSTHLSGSFRLLIIKALVKGL